MSKRIIATHNQVDPSLVTAEALTAALKNFELPFDLAKSLGWEDNYDYNVEVAALDAIHYIANLITLPEDTNHE